MSSPSISLNVESFENINNKEISPSSKPVCLQDEELDPIIVLVESDSMDVDESHEQQEQCPEVVKAENDEDIDIIGLSPEDSNNAVPEIEEIDIKSEFTSSLNFNAQNYAPPVRKAASAAAKNFRYESDFRTPQPTIMKTRSLNKKKHEVEEEKPKKSKRNEELKKKIVTKFDGRFAFFRKKHKQTRADLQIMENNATKMGNLVEAVMEGDMQAVPDAFQYYRNAVNSYKKALKDVRITMLTERKFASEIWGANNISLFEESTGKHTILDHIIEDLLKADYLPVYAEPKPEKKKEKKKVTAKAAPIPPPVKEKYHQVEEQFRWSDISCDEDMAITRSMTRPVNERESFSVPEKIHLPPPAPVKDSKKFFKKKRAAHVEVVTIHEPTTKKIKRETPSPLPVIEKKKDNPRFHRNSSAVETTPESESFTPVVAIPKVKLSPMPKFKIIDECRITKKAEEIIRDSRAFLCTCKPNKDGFGCYSNCINVHLHMECGSRCFLKEKCKNKRFQDKEYAAFEPFFAGAKGWGIRSMQFIRKGDFIVEYMGEVVDANETAKRLKKYARDGHRHHYMMGLRSGAVIDATKYGNYSRFVNHSCDPNAETQKWISDRMLRIGFFAKKDIKEGEEIVFDYAFERFGKKAQLCYCGSRNCTGFIGGKPEDMDEDEENEVVDDNSDLSDTGGRVTYIKSSKQSGENAAEKERVSPTSKEPKRKRTEEEKAEVKLLAKYKQRIMYVRREIRKVIGNKKKNFAEEDIQAIIRHMLLCKRYEERLLVSDLLLSITDDQVKSWFIEKNGLLSMWTWMSDPRYNFKKFATLLSQCYQFTQSLPVTDPKYYQFVKDSRLLELARHHRITAVTEEIEIEDVLACIVNSISNEDKNVDKDVLRILNRDTIPVGAFCDEIVKISTKLVEKWEEFEKDLKSDEINSDAVVDPNVIEYEEEMPFHEDRYPAIPTDRRLTPPTPSDISDSENSHSESRTESRSSFSSFSTGDGYRRYRSRSPRPRRHYDSYSRSDSRDYSSDDRSRSPRRSSYREGRYYHDDRRHYDRSMSRSYSPRRDRYYDSGRRYYERDRYNDRDDYRRGYRRDYDRRSYYVKRPYAPRGRQAFGQHGQHRRISPIRPSRPAGSQFSQYQVLKTIKTEIVEDQPRSHSPVRPPIPANNKHLPSIPYPKPVPPPQLLMAVPHPVAKDVVDAFPDRQSIIRPFINIRTKPQQPAIPVVYPPLPYPHYGYPPQMAHAPYFVPPPPPEVVAPKSPDPPVKISDSEPVMELFDDVSCSESFAEMEEVVQEPEKEPEYQPHPKNPNWLMIPEDGYYYYFNKETMETTWDEPPDLQTELANKRAANSQSMVMEIKQELMDEQEREFMQSSFTQEMADSPRHEESSQASSSGSSTNIHGVSRSSGTSQGSSNGYDKRHRSDQLLTADMRAKKDFKEKVWTYIYKYVRNWSKSKCYAENDVIEFCRQMTRLTLKTAVSGENYTVDESVLSLSRKTVDRNLTEFVKHTKPVIKPNAVDSSIDRHH